MFYGIMFYFDQPVKRLWYVASSLSGEEKWNTLYQFSKQHPTGAPNEIYKLMAGEHKHAPKVKISMENTFPTIEEAVAHINGLIEHDIKGMRVAGFSNEEIQANIINVDDAVRRIRTLRSAVSVNAGLYYDHGITAITDEEWDNMAKQLCAYQKDHAYALPFVNFFDKEFADFTPDTGFHLPYRSEPIYSTVLRAVEFLAQRK